MHSNLRRTWGPLESMRSIVSDCARPIHRTLRTRKLSIFFREAPVSSSDRLLDVGGGTGFDGEFIQLYARFSETVVVNLQPLKLDTPAELDVRSMVGDGCSLPFASKSFDWVFSNAVIEHVGAWEQQQRFAAEIRRVCSKGYFVTTPNKYFPIEPHTMCPFFQFLPRNVQYQVLRFWPGYMREYEEINLLSLSQFRELFPEATVRRAPFALYGNTLIAYHLKQKTSVSCAGGEVG